jgi:penicillin-binding protein 1C
LFTPRKFEVYEFWPGDFLALFAQADSTQSSASLSAGDWQRAGQSGRTKTDHCLSEQQRNSARFDKTIPLRAKADADVREIFWFAGKQFVGKAASNQVLEWTAAAGDYEVTALDDHGRAGSHSVTVR